MKNYVGEKYGKLTVLEVIKNHSETQYKYWAKCKCECGKEKLVNLFHVKHRDKLGLTPTCGCGMYQYNTGVSSYQSKGFGDILGRKWGGIKGNSKTRNIPFNITIQDGWEQFLKQNRKCAYSNEELYFRRTSYDYKYDTASLDRIDSKKGYDKENIQWIHKKINEIKWDLTEKKFLQLCYFLVNPIKHTEINESCVVIYHKGGFEGVGNLGLRHWHRILRNAKNRNIEVGISINDAWELFIKQQGYCALTGIPIYFNSSIDISSSLDRIDTDKDYSLDNIQWVHKDINYKLKKHYSESELKELAEKIVNHRKLNYTIYEN